jgi:hypothetical protein
MYEDNQSNGAYPSQGTTQVSLNSLLVIPASTQRDLQEHYRERLPHEKTALTTCALLAFRRKSHNLLGCVIGLTFPFESYCAE